MQVLMIALSGVEGSGFVIGTRDRVDQVAQDLWIWTNASYRCGRAVAEAREN